MNALRVLLATEQSFHREAVAAALRPLHPSVEVESTEPACIENAASRLAPDLVICSQTTPAARSGGIAWIQLSPNGYWLASIRGADDPDRRLFVSGTGLSDLVSTVDFLSGTLAGQQFATST